MTTLREIARRTTRPLLLLDVVDRYASECGSVNPYQRPLETPEYSTPRIYLVARISNGQRVDLSPPLRMMVQSTLSGLYSLFGGVIIGRGAELDQRRVARQDIRVNMVEAGTYVVRVSHPYYRTVEREVSLPSADGYPLLIQLEPSSSYPIAEKRTGLSGTVIANRQNPKDTPIPIPFARIAVEIKGRSRVQLPCTIRANAQGEWAYYFREALLDQHLSSVLFEVTLTVETPDPNDLPPNLPIALQPLRNRKRIAITTFIATRGTVTELPAKFVEVRVN